MMSCCENERLCSNGRGGLLQRRSDESPLLPEQQGPQPAVLPSSNHRSIPLATGPVRFRVGKEPDVQEFDAQRELLANANDVFFTSFNGSLPDNSEGTIIINDVDPRAFGNFLRFLEDRDVIFRSATTALLTLYVANKYMEPLLAIQCLNYLDNKLSSDVVPEILEYVSLLCGDPRGPPGGTSSISVSGGVASPLCGDQSTQTSPLASPYPCGYNTRLYFEDESASAPYLEDAVSSQQNEVNGWMAGCRGSGRGCQHTASAPSDNDVNKDIDMKTMWKKAKYLRHNCYEWVDCNADEILSSETAEGFDSQVLADILSRPTLGVSSETIVVDLLQRWSTSECRRKGLATTNENIMRCLGDLRFMARYLLMDTDEFLHGYKPTKGHQGKDRPLASPVECTAPAFSALLTQEESRWILDQIKHPHNSQPATIRPRQEPPSLTPWISTMKRLREPPVRNFVTLEGKPKDGKGKRKGGPMESSSVRSKLRAALSLGWRKSRREKRRREVEVVKEKPRGVEEGVSGRKRSKDSSTGRRCSGSCFAEYFFTALSCFFD